MLPVIQKDITEKYEMMDKETFLEYATLAQTLPGVIALNCACFVGRHVAGLLGMVVAGFGATFSAFVLMLAATIAIQYLPQDGPAMGAMRGVRAASAALILSAAFSLAKHNLTSAFSLIVTLATFALITFGNVSTPLVVLVAGVAGVLYRQCSKRKKGGHSA